MGNSKAFAIGLGLVLSAVLLTFYGCFFLGTLPTIDEPERIVAQPKASDPAAKKPDSAESTAELIAKLEAESAAKTKAAQSAPEFVSLKDRISEVNEQLGDGAPVIQRLFNARDGIINVHLHPHLDTSEIRHWANVVADEWAAIEGSGLPLHVNAHVEGRKVLSIRRN
ncbi:hypothetical protein [Crateriforma conspicua]|nr:hypothetical protein [Crateriforma conspicua]